MSSVTPPQGSTEKIAERLANFFNRPNPVLFAGSGVSNRVGYPTWAEYIICLANACSQYGDQDSANLIRSRLDKKRYLEAASVFKTSTDIPVGEQWKALAEPFKSEAQNLDRLDSLIKLPFGAIVTTNYDASLYHAYAKVFGKWLPSVDRGQLKSVSQSRSYFIARIHGCCENPTSMVVDVSDYKNIRKEDDYLDFVLNLLRTRSCLFLGFSFLDPAIDHVLGIYAERNGPTFEKLHTALVPSVDSELITKLKNVNIETIEYDSNNAHSEVWRIIRQAQKIVVASEPAYINAAFGCGGRLHRFLAFTHAQARVRSEAQPIVHLARDGLVASIVSSSAEHVNDDIVRQEVARLLRLSDDEAQQVVAESIDRLVARGSLVRNTATMKWIGPQVSELDQDLDKLAKDVLHRMRVRSGVRGTDRDHHAAKVLIENTLLTRAWDLGAHFAGGSSGWSADAGEIVDISLKGLPSSDQPGHQTALADALRGLLEAPDADEAKILTRVGRIAFGVQLVLASPRQSLFHQHALPKVIYLDANVLLPTITVGHPYSPTYKKVISRFARAARQAGVHFTIATGRQFLNEVVAHRKRAIEIVESSKLENPDNLRRHIQFHSAVNTNVYIGAYGSTGKVSEGKSKFIEFIQEIAPYEDEDQLADYLKNVKIQTTPVPSSKKSNGEFVHVFNSLQTAYEILNRDKPSVLVEHEAQQMTQFIVDSKNNINSIFVTADKQLREALATVPGLRRFSGHLVSNLGLIALADVMVGIDADASSLSRIMWLSAASSKERSLIDFFVNLGLRKYDENLSTELQILAEDCANDAADVAELQDLDLWSEMPQDVAKTNEFLDRFENRFYERWDEAIERRYRNM